MHADLALGIAAASRPDHARLGAELARLGYTELWVNDTPRGDGVRTLAELVGSTNLRLGIGVIALSEHRPPEIAERVRSAGMRAHRFTVGVGSGSSASLALVRDGVTELRRLLPDLPIAVAAVGPRMSHLAGEVADAVVANWALPDRLAFVRDRVDQGAAAASRPPPRLVAYVRTAVGPGAEERLRAEMARYAGYAPQYARAFAAQPDALVGVAVESGDGGALRSALEPYQSVADTVVVRGLPAEDTVDGWLAIARPVSVAFDESAD